MLVVTIILTAIGLAWAQLSQCPAGLGGASCPSSLRCQADPGSGDTQTYCMISTDLAQGAYCQNHFGLCAAGLVCGLADVTAPFQTCITPPTTTTTTTTTSTTTTSTTTTTVSTTSTTTISTSSST